MATSSNFRPVRFPVSTEGLAGSIYGTVTALAVIAAVSEYKATNLRLALTAVATVLALTLSHGYANWIGLRPSGNRREDFKLVVSHEWPIVVASLVVSAMLLIPLAFGMSEDGAVVLTLWFGVLILFALGYRASWRAGNSARRCLVLATFDALFGVVIVALKAAVH